MSEKMDSYEVAILIQKVWEIGGYDLMELWNNHRYGDDQITIMSDISLFLYEHEKSDQQNVKSF